MFVGGIQMIAVGIIGEYISRIHKDVRNRPLYLVKGANIFKQP
jgi:dolichol-phosphate mannosyltransferase